MTGRPTYACPDVDDLAGLYVLDALGPDEAAEVRAHLADHAERHPAFAALAATTPFLAGLADPVPPPADLRERVMGAIAATPQEGPPARPAARSAPAAPPASAAAGPTPAARPARLVPTEPPADGARPTPTLEAPRRRARPVTWLALSAAAVIAIVALGGWNVLLQRRMSDAEHRVAVLAEAAAAAGHPGSTVVPMTGSDAAEGAAGYAVFPRDGTGYIVLMGLLPAPDDHVWQAWMLDDEHAASAGLMSVDTDGLAMLEGVEPMPGMALVAVTMEPAGGSPGPTTTPVVVGQLDAPLAGEGDGSLALMR